MQEQLHQVFQILAEGALSILAVVITGLVAWASRSAQQWMASKAHMASFACATEKVQMVIDDAVREVEQTLVRQLKEDNKWDADTARMARDTAVNIAKRQLGERGLKELQGCLGLAIGDLTRYFQTKVEAAVSRSGDGTGPIVGLD